MFCPHCGTKQPDNARFCGSCGKAMPSAGAAAPAAPAPPVAPPAPAPPVAARVPTYDSAHPIPTHTPATPAAAPARPAAVGPQEVPTRLGLAILGLLMCLPVGAVAVAFSRQARRQAAAGNIEAARNAARSAGRWGCAAVIIGLVAGCFSFISMMAYLEQQGAFR